MRQWNTKRLCTDTNSSSPSQWVWRIKQSDPKRLADLLDMEGESGWDWHPDELGSIFEHQMQLPLRAGLLELSPALPFEVESILRTKKDLPKRFGQIFFVRNVDTRFLKWIHTSALRCLDRKTSPLPREIVRLIACLAEAADLSPLPRTNPSPSKSSRWHKKALKLPWLHTPYRTLLLKHLNLIASKPQRGARGARRLMPS